MPSIQHRPDKTVLVFTLIDFRFQFQETRAIDKEQETNK